MHKGIILLTKAENREEAISEIRSFLEPYGNDVVFDYYKIGGRFHNTLAPKNLEWGTWADNFLWEQEKIKVEKAGKAILRSTQISQNTVNENQEVLQKKWEELGMKGQNPATNHEISLNGDYYDVVPLSECLKTVNGWQQDPIKAGKQELAEAEKWLNGENGKDNYGMYGHLLIKAGNLFCQEFCSSCHVFNIEEHNYSVPSEVEGWWAIMIDIHH